MNFDVGVIGASTAGLYTAELLARAGLSVAVYERERKHNPSRRTLIVTPTFRQVLNSGTPEAAALHQSGVMRLASSGLEEEIRFNSPDPVVERSIMTRRLMETAQSAGVCVHYGYRFLRFEKSYGELRVLFEKDGSERFATIKWAVIGADGAGSDVARAVGINRPGTVPILQAEVDLPDDWDPNVTKVWFDPATTRYFYWLIPESHRRGVAGLIGEHHNGLRSLLDSFLAKQRLRAYAYQGAQVALHHPKLKPWGMVGGVPVLLVGDAAGQVKVTTVGGTVTGFAGAKAAANSILNGTPYRRELQKLKRELDLHWWIRRALDRLDHSGYDELLRSLSPPVQEFLGRYDRDSMARVFWKLPLLEPRLVKVGLKSLFGHQKIRH